MSVVVSMRERRAAVRVDIGLDGYVTELTEEGAFPGDEELLVPLYGRVLNLSETGLLLHTEEPICPGREVRIVIGNAKRRVALQGYVVRVSHLAFERGALLAIELFDLEPHARRLVNDLVESHRPDPVLN